MRIQRPVLVVVLAALAVVLAGCPLGRPVEVDCGGVQNKVTQSEQKLAPFADVDPKAATDEQVKSWTAAATGAHDAMSGYDGTVHKEVTDAYAHYRAAVDALQQALIKRATASDAAASEAVIAARAEITKARGQVDKACPARP